MFQDTTNTDLTDALYAAHAHHTRAKAKFIMALAEIHNRELATELGAHSTITLLTGEFDLSRSTAYKYLQVGTILAKLPHLSDAFLTGAVSYSKVRFLMRYITADTDNALTELAKTYPLTKLKTVMAGSESSTSEKPADDFFKLSVDGHGNFRFAGCLNPTAGAWFTTALKIGELSHHTDLNSFTKDELNNHDILNEALIHARENPSFLLPRDPLNGRYLPPSRLDLPHRTNLLPAFFGLINVARTSPGSHVTAPGAHVQVMVTDNGRAFMPHNHAAPSSTLIDDVLGGDLQHHLLGKDGLTIHLTKKQRMVTAAQQQALLVQWMFQCASPTCNHARFLQFHHIIDHSKGGPTELWDLIPLCSACHSKITNGINRLEFSKRNTLIFIQANGRQYVSENRRIPMALSNTGFEFVDWHTDDLDLAA